MNATEAMALLPQNSSIPSYQNSMINDEWLEKQQARVKQLENDYQKERRYTLIRAGISFSVSVLGAVATPFALNWNAMLATATLMSSIIGFSLGAALLLERCGKNNPRDRAICQIVMDKSQIENWIRRLSGQPLADFADHRIPISDLCTPDFSEFEILSKETENRFSSLVHLRRTSLCLQTHDAPIFNEHGSWLQERWQALQHGSVRADLAKTQKVQV